MLLKSILICGLSLFAIKAISQENPQPVRSFSGVPFLLINPDARTAGLSETGLATLSEGGDYFLNASKMTDLKSKGGFSVSYVPWLNNFSRETNLGYLSGYLRLGQQFVLGSSIKYFSLGSVELRDNAEQNLGTTSPNEFAIDLSVAQAFGKEFSLSSTLRYIRSDFGGGSLSGATIRAGQTVAMDVGASLRKQSYFMGFPATLGFGLSISNLGPKIGYADSDQNKLFLPASLRLGASSVIESNEDDRITLALDLSKLMVPESDGDQNQLYGQKSAVDGLFSSFSDSPAGFRGELRDVGISVGDEYSYRSLLAIRAGYHHAGRQYGTRFFSLGMGFRYQILKADFSYLFAGSKSDPLASTLRLTLGFSFDAAMNVF